ncbi:MAG: hypothetical protein FJY95_10110 [Candidatus Handelsmanbacteria bacterium]|nr:hypothetical protein [Candidatus Handelsmanbacteria bacterium]
MNDRQRSILYGVLGVLVLAALLVPFEEFRWEEAKRPAALLLFAAVVGGVLWRIARRGR